MGGREKIMDREMVIQNIMVNYGKYGITQDIVEEVIDAGIEGGMSYDLFAEGFQRLQERNSIVHLQI